MCRTVNVRLLNAREKKNNANFVAHREMRIKLKWRKKYIVGMFYRNETKESEKKKCL